MIAALLALALLGQPGGGLRIVVVEGEDAVNIIQQKTAVRPVIEVRDRNNLPVAGALVTFTIEGGKAASFGGASTLTVATNAAGQAAVTGLTPTAAGAFHIQVQAAFQGQLATATIAQTNVMTAAQAAAAGASGASSGSGASGASGASGGAGGGLSATTIGVVGGAVAGGAIAATQIAKDDAPAERTFSGALSGQLVSTIVGVVTCSVTRAVSGTLTIRLDDPDAATLSGEAEISGSDVVISQTCPGPSPANTFARRTRVTGTAARLGFREETTMSAPLDIDPRVTVNTVTTVVFEGNLSGGVISGTLTYDERSTFTGTNSLSAGSASATFPITLR